MKKILSVMTFVVFISCAPTYHATVVNPTNPLPDQEERSYQVFYDELGPYGRWIDYPNEGYVWSPNVDQNFQPYATNGHWVYTEQGWTWVSDYTWGWAPFHYGRWFYEDGYGWLWVPGHEWAPAWVTWGKSDNYYGWAPLGPNIEANQQWEPPQNSWSFVPAEHMNNPHVSQYVVDKSNNTTIIKNVTVINNTTIINNRNVTNNNITNNTSNNSNNTTNTRVLNNNINNTNNNTTNTHVTNNNTNNNTNNTTNNHVTNTTVNSPLRINPTIINKGPQVTELQKVTKVPIQKATVIDNNKPVQTKAVNDKLVIYRPLIKETNSQQNDGNKPIPQKVEQYKVNKLKN